jgi:mannose/cellobiose epimerase-like protein (N-acyl-D-glucosamine 2-epimerase family)
MSGAETMDLRRYAHFFAWLKQSALPLWLERGVDRVNGGFIERLGSDGAVLDDPRRARLVARQIFVFATASKYRWLGNAEPAITHGLAWLRTYHVSGRNTIKPLVSADGECLRDEFDLYDQAFTLFGLAAVQDVQPADEHRALARTLLAEMEKGWRHPTAGFEESVPRSLPLKANPHMHMLEASLAWELLDPDGSWSALADEIVGLCLSRFISPAKGALHEFFDGNWMAIAAPPDDVVEPGHQAEWAWLLMRWAARRGRPEALAPAKRFVAIAEDQGRNSTLGLLLNELDGSLNVRDPRMRLWPQTERIKALTALLRITHVPEQRGVLEDALDEAVHGLMRFFDHPVRGSWWEHIAPSGAPLDEPARASSLYHIVCAAAELEDFLSAYNATVAPLDCK